MFRSISILLLRGMSKPKSGCTKLHGTKCDVSCNLDKIICCFYCKNNNQCGDDRVCWTYKKYRAKRKTKEGMPEKVIFT